jgi:S1-C subfamily serine protease
MKSYFFRTAIGIIVCLIGLTPKQSIAQSNLTELVTTKKSNPDLEFVEFISGVKKVLIRSTSDLTKNLYDSNNATYNILLSGAVKHLNSLGIWTTGDEEHIAKVARDTAPCDRAEIHLGWSVVSTKRIAPDIKVRDIIVSAMVYTCMSDYFYFEFPATVSSDAVTAWQGMANEFARQFNFIYRYNPENRLKPKALKSFPITSFQEAREHFDSRNLNPIEGVYEFVNDVGACQNHTTSNYELAILSDSTGVGYHVIYLNGTHVDFWKPGELKASIRRTADPSLYHSKYLMGNKAINDRVTLNVIDASHIEFRFPQDNGGICGSNYIRMYPLDVVTTARKASVKPNPTDKALQGTGSGVIISTSGLVVTNYHVIENAGSVALMYKRGDEWERIEAKIIATDRVNDLAVLKADSEIIDTIPYTIKARAEVGESVIAMGYPLIGVLGSELKVTDGIISSLSGFQDDVTTYQITTAIQSGNSGGPLFSMSGELLGIVNAKVLATENVGYAIKVGYVLPLLMSLSDYNMDENRVVETGSHVQVIAQLRKSVVLVASFE